MKRVKLYAYTANNVGDDLMIEILLKRYKNHQFYCPNAIPANSPLRQYPNFFDKENLYRKYGRANHLFNLLTLYKRPDFFFKKVFDHYERSCKCAVYIGGSIYMQFPEETIEKRIENERQKLAHGPLFVIGANFGPFQTDEFREAFRRYFACCQGVSFRDKKSYDYFGELPHVQYAPDVVFNLPKGSLDVKREGKHVVISLIDVKARRGIQQYAEAYEQLIVDICEKSVQDGKSVVLISFCEAEGDGKAIDRILNRLPSHIREAVSRYDYSGDTSKVLAIFSEASFVLATRFHAMVLSLVFKKPFFAIAYNPKIQNVLTDVGCSQYCKLDEIGRQNINNILECGAVMHIDEYVLCAEKQFAQLDSYLRN